MTADDVRRIASAARDLTLAHERRADGFRFVTLAEEAAVYRLAEAIAAAQRPRSAAKAA